MIKNVIFDFGGVLMDWNPRYFFKSYFNDDEKMEFFLNNIATDEWNIQQDKGRSLAEGTELLLTQHPNWEQEIRAYYSNWTTMLRADIPKNVQVLKALSKTNYKLFGLTNWSAETFPYALKNYSFFELFEGKIVVSGTEKLIKPDPNIWLLLLDRYTLKAEESVFVDDNLNNIKVAQNLGFKCVYIQPNTNLDQELKKLGLSF